MFLYLQESGAARREESTLVLYLQYHIPSDSPHSTVPLPGYNIGGAPPGVH